MMEVTELMTNYEVKNYDEIRDSLRVRLMDMKSNADKLQDLIYEPMGCGYALVAYMELPESLAAGGIANVPKSLVQIAGASKRLIMHDAMVGSMTAEQPRLCPIHDMLFGSEAGLSAVLSSLTAASMLVFSLLYTPCVAAVAAIRRELGRKWSWGVVAWQCGIAWIAALIVRLIGMLLGVG